MSTTPRDARVLEMLRSELAAFDLQLSSPEKVIKKVASLIGDLQDVDVSLIEELRRVWWPVEFAFALSVDQERGLTEDELAQLRDSVLALESRLGPGSTPT
jgi:hypothetical protein